MVVRMVRELLPIIHAIPKRISKIPSDPIYPYGRQGLPQLEESHLAFATNAMQC